MAGGGNRRLHRGKPLGTSAVIVEQYYCETRIVPIPLQVPSHDRLPVKGNLDRFAFINRGVPLETPAVTVEGLRGRGECQLNDR